MIGYIILGTIVFTLLVIIWTEIFGDTDCDDYSSSSSSSKSESSTYQHEDFFVFTVASRK